VGRPELQLGCDDDSALTETAECGLVEVALVRTRARPNLAVTGDDLE
jgi:hypothetical protein